MEPIEDMCVPPQGAGTNATSTLYSCSYLQRVAGKRIFFYPFPFSDMIPVPVVFGPSEGKIIHESIVQPCQNGLVHVEGCTCVWDEWLPDEFESFARHRIVAVEPEVQSRALRKDRRWQLIPTKQSKPPSISLAEQL